MIVKVTRGKAMLGAVQYLAADKAGVARDDPHVVAGLGREGERLDPGTVLDVAHELDVPRAMFGTEIKDGHVFAVALVADQGDGLLTDDQWRRISEGFVERMDFGEVRWIAVRHGLNSAGADHAHLLVNMVREDGGRARDDWYLRRASRAVRAVERDHGLKVNQGRELGIKDRGYHGAEVAIAERLHGPGTEPAPDYIRRVLRAASVEAPGEERFVRYLREHAVTAHAGRVEGYSYSVPGSRQYQGSKLAPDLSWRRIEARWQSPVAETADQAAHDTAGRLAAWSLQEEGPRPGPIARESRELGRFAQTRAGAPLVLVPAMAAMLRARIRAAEQQREQDEREQRRRGPRAERDHGIGF